MTPKKTIYVREEDQETFEKAKELADEESLSQTIAKALKDLIKRKKAKEEGFKEITIEVGTWPADEAKQTEKIKFYGRELNYHEELHDTPGGKEPQTTWQLYQGERGKFLLYKKEYSRWIEDIVDTVRRKESSEATYEIFDSLEELEKEKDLPNGFLRVAKSELGQKGVKRLNV